MVVDKRIFHGNQITRLNDIKPGLKVRWNNADFGPISTTEEVIGEPFLRGESLWVRVRDEHDWEHDMSLSDMGVVPYLHAGGWNEKNWLERVVVLVPDLQPGDLFEMKSNYDKSPWWTYQVIEVHLAHTVLHGTGGKIVTFAHNDPLKNAAWGQHRSLSLNEIAEKGRNFVRATKIPVPMVP
jgi:hypothetical protein